MAAETGRVPELADFAGGPDPGSWQGAVHTLTVRKIRPPLDRFDDGELDYDLAHPAGCETRAATGGAGEYTQYTCDIAQTEGDVGLAFALRYSGTPVTKPGTYAVRGWGSKTYYHECGYEYDAGVEIIG